MNIDKRAASFRRIALAMALTAMCAMQLETSTGFAAEERSSSTQEAIDTGSGRGGENGIIVHSSLNHPIVATSTGSSINMVTGAVSDSSAPTGWDYRIGSINGLRFGYPGPGNPLISLLAIEFEPVPGVTTFQPGDTIGGSTTSTAVYAFPSQTWLSGTDAYLGAKFQCNGRLPFPQPDDGGFCYGYIHLQTTGPTGFPATILDAAFDGDGNPIVIPTGAPAVTLVPASIALETPADSSVSATLSVSNAPGGSPLTFSITAHDLSGKGAHAASGKIGRFDLTVEAANPLLQAREPLPQHRHRATSREWDGTAIAKWYPDAGRGSLLFAMDDGSYESVEGLVGADNTRAAVWLNRFSVEDAITVDSFSVLWPSTDGLTVGMQPNLVVYYDAAQTGSPVNATRIGGDHLVTIGQLDEFEDYSTSFEIPGAGDIYIGFVDQWGLIPGGYPAAVMAAALDRDSSLGRSYLSANLGPPTDITTLSNNQFTGPLSSLGAPGNLLVRATGSTGGACGGAPTLWLSTAPSSGTVGGGASRNVVVTADPVAAGLAPGTYNSELCVTTNDPDQPLISVPVSLTVTEPAEPYVDCTTDDTVFCDGFDIRPSLQLVSDPSFEATTAPVGPNPYWQSEANGPIPGVSTFYPTAAYSNSGTWHARFGGWGANQPQHPYIAQSVAFPNGGPLYLNYYLYLEAVPSVPSDLTILIDGVPVRTTDMSVEIPNPEYVQYSIDVSAFADGATHQIRFQYDYNGSGTSDGTIRLDDVTVDRTPIPEAR